MPDTNTIYKKIIRGIFYCLSGIAALILVLAVYLVAVAVDYPPVIKDESAVKLSRSEPARGIYRIGNSWLRKSKSGLYELYIEGTPFERGVINGKLSKELVGRQEDYFTEQISKMIPSKFYLHFLKYFIGWFNRDLSNNIPEEYKEEIYGVSLSASPKYRYIGSDYQRILNYHAAHDIGHALQSMALVGCTSFGTWADKSAEGNLIIGRNFDFYVGDKFSREKIIAFINPSEGYRFMTVTWGGFIGAVSGMNEQGLTVTINAAKTNIPSGSATPVSLVAREVLQYAKNIEEATQIIKKRKMFVSESFLVASAADNKAVVIEKTPENLDVYDPGKNYITCANHFQSRGLKNSAENRSQIEESASAYRYNRLTELLASGRKNTVQKTIDILRDTRGIKDRDIGLGNEKAINQLMAHHSIVFEPQKLLVWISTSPWQLGEFAAYDMKKVFALKGKQDNKEIREEQLTIKADPFLLTRNYKNFLSFRNLRRQISDGNSINPDSIILMNPEYYLAYSLAGDYCYKRQQYKRALGYYKTGLTKVIATQKEQHYLSEQVKSCLEQTED